MPVTKLIGSDADHEVGASRLLQTTLVDRLTRRGNGLCPVALLHQELSLLKIYFSVLMKWRQPVDRCDRTIELSCGRPGAEQQVQVFLRLLNPFCGHLFIQDGTGHEGRLEKHVHPDDVEDLLLFRDHALLIGKHENRQGLFVLLLLLVCAGQHLPVLDLLRPLRNHAGQQCRRR